MKDIFGGKKYKLNEKYKSHQTFIIARVARKTIKYIENIINDTNY